MRGCVYRIRLSKAGISRFTGWHGRRAWRCAVLCAVLFCSVLFCCAFSPMLFCYCSVLLSSPPVCAVCVLCCAMLCCAVLCCAPPWDKPALEAWSKKAVLMMVGESESTK
eukprot:gnl/Trimastix_PCT/267.p3 GENE.gnl/Trimastix_PCT/267~~gnl/Trimastix_PCT/267.p3  ORF type:complete len:110 (-),score=0.34 gnl/Trimastix_PCT/267:1142-1471(-)